MVSNETERSSSLLRFRIDDGIGTVRLNRLPKEFRSSVEVTGSTLEGAEDGCSLGDEEGDPIGAAEGLEDGCDDVVGLPDGEELGAAAEPTKRTVCLRQLGTVETTISLSAIHLPLDLRL